jgi:hypothetical protein
MPAPMKQSLLTRPFDKTPSGGYFGWVVVTIQTTENESLKSAIKHL